MLATFWQHFQLSARLLAKTCRYFVEQVLAHRAHAVKETCRVLLPLRLAVRRTGIMVAVPDRVQGRGGHALWRVVARQGPESYATS